MGAESDSKSAYYIGVQEVQQLNIDSNVANRGSQTIVMGWDRIRDLRITRKAS